MKFWIRDVLHTAVIWEWVLVRITSTFSLFIFNQNSCKTQYVMIYNIVLILWLWRSEGCCLDITGVFTNPKTPRIKLKLAIKSLANVKSQANLAQVMKTQHTHRDHQTTISSLNRNFWHFKHTKETLDLTLGDDIFVRFVILLTALAYY